MQQNSHDFFDQMHENDREKVQVLLRSFATPEDLKLFIETSRENQREIERRRWAWDMIKKIAAAVVLIGSAIVALRNFILADWLNPRP